MNTSIGARWPWPLFLVLAYGITWAVQIPAYLYLVPRGTAPTNEVNFLLLSTGGMDPGTAIAVLLLCFSFGPSVAGIVVVALESGRSGLRDLLACLVKARIPGKWILFVLLFPTILSSAAVAVGWIFGGMAPLDYTFLVPVALAVPFLLFLIVCTGLAEELGWRGFALPYLQRSRTAERQLDPGHCVGRMASALCGAAAADDRCCQPPAGRVLTSWPDYRHCRIHNRSDLALQQYRQSFLDCHPPRVRQCVTVIHCAFLRQFCCTGGLRGPTLGPRRLAAEEVRRRNAYPPLSAHHSTTPGTGGIASQHFMCGARCHGFGAHE